MIWGPIRFALLAMLALACTPLGPRAAVAQPPAGIDITHIPGEAIAIVVLRPRQVLTATDLKWLPTEVFSASGQESLGIEPADVDQVIGFVGPPPGGLFAQQPPIFGAVVRFNQPYRQAAVLPQLRPQLVEAQHAGKTYLRGPRPEMPAVAFLSDKTLLIGSEPGVQAMLETAKADGSAIDLLKQADATADALLLVAMDPIRPLIGMGLAAVPQPPPDLADLFKIPPLVSALELKLNIRPRQPNSFTVRATDDAAAVELEKLLANGVAAGRKQILAAIPPAGGPADDPVNVATNKYLQRISLKAVDWLKPQRKGAQLTFTMGEGSPQAGVAVVGIGTALLLPAVQRVREAARRTQSSNQLRQLVLAMHLHEANNRKLPARAIVDKNGKPLLSWRVTILPYIEQKALYDRFKLDEPWDSPHNRQLLALMPETYRTPGTVGTKTGYMMPVGKGTLYEKVPGIELEKIPDGTSNTLILVEADQDRAVEWSKPEDFAYDPDRPLAGLGSNWPGGFIGGFADGSTRFITSSVDVKVLRAMFTAAGAEPVPFDLD